MKSKLGLVLQRQVNPDRDAQVGAILPKRKIGIVKGSDVDIAVADAKIAAQHGSVIFKNPGKGRCLRVGAVTFGGAFVGDAGSITFKRVNVVELAGLERVGDIVIHRAVLVLVDAQ